MNITKHIGLWGALAMTSMMAQAQTHITFDTEDYGTLGVYDTWVDSPFRTGQLNGNVQVVDNHLTDDETNTSAKILGVQRSRFGSNTFGAKINLKETFELTPTQRYVHVMMHKPVEGKVMLIGLGKRADRAEQSNEVEQFWTYPLNEVKTGEWFDAVFPIKGNGGIDIYSLVIVPHCEAPHTLGDDFVAYVDDIYLDDSSIPRVGAGDYTLNFTADTPHGRANERWTSKIGLNGSADGNQSINIPTSPNKMAYNQLFDIPFKAKAGETVTAQFGYTSSWMHSYVYIDRDGDGQFSAMVDDNLNLNSSCDLMAYTLYSNGASTGKNSAGTSISDANNGFNVSITPPSFTIPSNLANGFYRMRYKVDWNNIDAGGDINSFISNGGIIVDVMLNVHGDYCNVTNDNRNGEVQTATGETLNGYRAAFGQPLKVKMIPSNGFEYSGIRIRHGYNLTGDSLVHGNPQYRDVIIYADEFDAEDCVTIPAEYMDGDVLIEGLFVEEGAGDGRMKVTYNVVLDEKVILTKTIKVTKGSEWPDHGFTSEASSVYYTLSAKPSEGVVENDTVVVLNLKQNLPFKTSVDFANARWHHLAISSSKNYIAHSSSSYIGIGATTTATPAESDENAQWAFIGDVLNGFQIVNKGAGEGKILSSNHDTSTNTGGSTFPVMTATPVPSTHNTYWVPTKSNDISGANGFYLHQLGQTSNKLNKRDDKLAYWTGGADAGSTLVVTELTGYAVTITAPASSHGTLEVFDGEDAVNSGSRVDEGTVLTIVATPNAYYSVTEITVNGTPIEAVDGVYTYTVGTEAITVAASFLRDPNAPIEYCIPEYAGTGSSRTTTTRTDRYLRNLEVTDGVNSITTESYGSTSGRQVYKDETSKILTTTAGATISLTVNASMWAMHNFIYVDFNLDGLDSNDRVMYSDEAAGTFTFTIPANQAPGTYRVRHMIDWTNTNPCEFAQGQGSDNAEAVTDFLLVIESQELAEPRTVTVISANEALGTVAITDPATEDSSVSTTQKAVTVEATAADDAAFMNWTANGEVVSTETTYTYTGETDIELTANFGYTVTYTVGSEGNAIFSIDGAGVTSGDVVAAGSMLTITVSPVTGKDAEVTVNDQAVALTGNTCTIPVDGNTVINVAFVNAKYVFSLTVEGQGNVEVWTAGTAKVAPSGTQYQNGDEVPAESSLKLYIKAAEGWKFENATYDKGNGSADEITKLLDVTADGYEGYLFKALGKTTGNAIISVTFVQDSTSGIIGIGMDPADGPIEYFNLQGVQVSGENLIPGFYIVRQGDKTAKILVK